MFTCFVAEMSTTDSSPEEKEPEHYGQKLDEEMYHIVWFEGNVSPHALDIVCEHKEAQKHNSGG